VLFAFAALAFGLRPDDGWVTLAVAITAWSACVLLMGAGAATLARTPAQLSAAGDIFALLTTIVGGAVVPTVLLPGWLKAISPISPGHWALEAYQAALTRGMAQLVHPLLALAGFGAVGVIVAAVISNVQSPRPHRRSHRPAE
jgi:ABC-2 type transport system permease protein